MISSIKLNNWRSHDNTVLDFKDGTNLLMGIMGSGKSSVLSAICFALFGTFPELERRKLKLEDVLRLNEKDANIALEFKWNAHSYKIERSLKNEKRNAKEVIVSDATAYKNDMVTEKGPNAVTRFIEEELKIDYDLFTRAIYSEQNNIDYFLTIDPKRRKEEMDILLGLDKFETARANIVSTINRIKTERKMLEERFSKLELENLKQKLRDSLEKMSALEENIKKSDKELKDINEMLKTRQEAFNGLNTKKRIYDNLIKQRIGLESIIENIKKEIVEVDENRVEILKNEKNSMDERKNKLNNEIRIIDIEITKLNKEIATSDNRIYNCRKSKNEIEMAESEIKKMPGIEEIKKSLSEIEERIIHFSSEKNAGEKELKELLEVSGRILTGSNCPLCGSDIDRERITHIVEERKKRIEDIRNMLHELEKAVTEKRIAQERDKKAIRQIEGFQEKISLLKKNNEDAESLEKMKKSQEEKLAANNGQKEERQKNVESLTKTLQNIAVELNQLENMINKKKNLINSEQNLKEVINALSVLTFDEKTYDQSRMELEELRFGFQKISSEKTAKENEAELIKSMNEVLAKDISNSEKTGGEIMKLLSLEEELTIYKNALLETQVLLRANLTEAINAAIDDIWHIFYPYKDYKALRLNVTERDYIFEIFDSEWKVLETVASGGERACAALTLRVALAMILTPNLSMLILDEPTHNLDKEAVELLSEALQFKVPEVVEQTFVITHEESLMGSEFASSYRFFRNKENFEATRVEKI